MKIFKFAASLLLFAVLSAPVFGQKLKAEEIVAKHLDSIGTSQTRAAVKNQIAVGDIVFKNISTKIQPVAGRIVLASEGVKNFFGMSLNAPDYPLEKFSYDGKKSKVSYIRTNARSILGTFVVSNDLLLEDSLLGGTLATSWALMNLANNKAKLESDGTKKIDGKEVYILSYSAKGGSDIDIKLYFEKETFRHIRTEYKRISSASQNRTLGTGVSRSDTSLQNESRLRVVEDFSDFKTENGLTLPHAYTLYYSINGQNGLTELEWQFNLTQFAFNQKLDAKTFDAEAK